jgi:hypothetical protein
VVVLPCHITIAAVLAVQLSEVKMEHPSTLINLLEKELLAFASDNNAKKLLLKYSVNLDDEKMQKALVIWSTEFRHVLEKWTASLPEDAAEAEHVLSRKKGATGPRNRKQKEELEVLDDTDLM